MKQGKNCINVAVFLATLFPSCVSALSRHQHQQQNQEVQHTGDSETDSEAVIYIIAVLAFYSIGVVVMIIHYLGSDHKDFEEEVVQENIVLKGPRKDHPLSQVGQQVFDTVTSISCDEDDDNEATGPRVINQSSL